MKTLTLPVLLLTCVLAAFTPTFTGCKTATQEAVIYYTFRDTQTVVHAAYAGFADRVVMGKVKAPEKARVEAAYRKYQLAFKTAFNAARQNWKAATPEQVRKLADEVLLLISTL